MAAAWRASSPIAYVSTIFVVKTIKLENEYIIQVLLFNNLVLDRFAV